MLRDSSISPLDAVAVEDIDLTALNMETVRGYRQMFKLTNPSHLWNTLDDEIFLRRIRAIGAGKDGIYHPTEAGLLMFGYEYEITRRFPQYFLDYQEDRNVVGVAKWKDRIVSSSGDWSGNVFDFAMKILAKLQSDLKIPFVVKGFQRIDDTPLHRLLREAVTNCLVHADYYGRQGIVVSKNKDGFVFANPGGMRISKSEALSGGVSDPRNATLLKMFSFIRFGERAGSGLNGIVYVWKKVYHTAPEIFVKEEYDRTFLKLPTLGKEPDVEAMAEFYPDEEETSDKQAINIDTVDKTSDKRAINIDTVDKTSDNALTNTKSDTNIDSIDKQAAIIDSVDKLNSKQATILQYMSTHSNATAKELSQMLGIGITRLKQLLIPMVNSGLILTNGANKNRTYSLNIDIVDKCQGK